MAGIEKLDSLINEISRLSQDNSIGVTNTEKEMLSLLANGLSEAGNLSQEIISPPEVNTNIVTAVTQAKENNNNINIQETFSKAFGEGLYVSLVV